MRRTLIGRPVPDLEKLEYERDLLLNLALTLPHRIRQAEERGHDHFAVMIYGYEVVYTKIDSDRWHAYLNDTAD